VQTSAQADAPQPPAATPVSTSTPAPAPVPTPEPKDGFDAYPTDISLNGYANRGLSVADGAVVYIRHPLYSDICAINMQTGEISMVGVTSDLTRDTGPQNMVCIFDGYIYFTANGYDFINDRHIIGVMRIRADGTGEETVFVPEGLDDTAYERYMLHNCAAYGQYILYNYEVDGSPMVFWIDMATGGSTQLKALSTRHVASDGEYIYCDLWMDDNGPGLCRVSMDSGGMKVKVVGSGAMPELIVPVGDWIYYTSYATNPEKIYRVKKDGSDSQELGVAVGLTQFNVAGDYLYYADPGDGRRLYRMKTDGTGKEKICDIENLLKISISAGRIFLEYTEREDGGYMYFASVMPDGSGLIDLTEILSEAQGTG